MEYIQKTKRKLNAKVKKFQNALKTKKYNELKGDKNRKNRLYPYNTKYWKPKKMERMRKMMKKFGFSSEKLSKDSRIILVFGEDIDKYIDYVEEAILNRDLDQLEAELLSNGDLTFVIWGALKMGQELEEIEKECKIVECTKINHPQKAKLIRKRIEIWRNENNNED